MTPEKFRKAEELLVALWDCPPEFREQRLATSTAGDAELLAEVKSLLEASEQAASWQPPQPSAQPPQTRQFGPYQIERMIGRGGMGAVYLAHRSDGNFNQKVAIKIIGLPFEIEAFQQRFRQERQILASLNHPNITRLIDGGITPEGELYLAMEYVDGLQLDDYLQGRHLSESQRLHLFLQIAGAVAYAHQNLVVHRDLKPGNILVTPDGLPKLLDFGTAKLLDGETNKNTTSTSLLTFAYASPEQLRGLPATTLSDVYSLGLLLHEMLTGVKTFQSGLFSRLEALAGEPALTPVSGELDLVVRKAMAQSPQLRYTSVEQLSADVQRYLQGQPLLAHPESASYRARKFLLRHRWPVLAASLTILAVLIGAFTTAWQARRAEYRFQQVRQLGKYLVFNIHDNLQELPGSTALRKEVVERAMVFLDALSTDSSSSPELRLEIAAGYGKLADVLGNPNRSSLGERTRAVATYQKALDALAPLASDRKNRPAHRLAAQLRVQQAATEDFGVNRKQAMSLLKEGVDSLRQLSAEDPTDLPTQIALAEGLELLAKRTSSGGGVTETIALNHAQSYYDESAQALGPGLKANPSNPVLLQHMAQIEYGRALLLGSADPNKAIGHHTRASQWLDKFTPADANRLEIRRLRANNALNLGWAQGQARDYTRAIANISKAGDILQGWAAADPSNTPAQYQLTTVFRSRGIVNGYRGDTTSAIRDFQSAVAIHRALLAKDPGNSVYRYLQGELLVRVGNLQLQEGHRKEAHLSATEGIGILTALASKPTASLSHTFGACRWMTETKVASARNAAEAARYCQKAIDQTKGEDPDGWEGLANAREQLGDRTGAVAAAKRALALLPPTVPGKADSEQRRTMTETLRRLLRSPQN